MMAITTTMRCSVNCLKDDRWSDPIRDLYGNLIVASWEKIPPLVVEIRKRSPSSWDNFEYLYRSMKEIDQLSIKA